MVAPVNPAQRAAAGAGASGGARGARGGHAVGTWLTPSAVAKATGGEVLQRGRGCDGVATDSRADCTGRLFVALRGVHHDAHDHVAEAIRRGARGAVVGRPLHEIPGVDRAILDRAGPDRAGSAFFVRVADTGDALLKLAAEHRRRNRAKVVGITGSCGKTTTKEWLGGVLGNAMPTVASPGSFNNQVGVPLTLLLIGPETRAAVVEIGTNAPGEIALLTATARPDIAIVTCVAAAHLQGLGSIEGVAREKAQLPAGLHEDGVAILNGDDQACRAMAGSTRAKVKFVAVDREADWFATDIRFHAFGTSFRLQGERCVTVPRLGTHNVYNALFVIAAATELGMPEQVVLQALCDSKPAARRLEPKQQNGITVFDDTYNMNPESARAGLQAIAGVPGPGRRVAVFGEMLELGAGSRLLHEQLGRDVARAGIDLFVAVGEGARPIAEGALDAGMQSAAVLCAESVEDALALLRAALRPGDRVLCKASRRVALDRLVDRLLGEFAGGEAGAAKGTEGG
jgi:UDP-N-acetylmuramoyl-tripeptide--D-alanyl-D-alanine ligase